ncbi:uncharacterized protein LOC135338816 isoform X2 [Halichondria panicea]|uniref:uncharacterized protein LOC135338816 isoform X2 n=1 Tax=Halichondria panicea TaxID=6063 RepID=UPI00312B5653
MRLDDLLRSIDVSIADNQPKSDWRKRMDTREENWEAFRSKLFEEVVMYSSMPADSACFMCGDESPQIRCHQCGASQYMCNICDVVAHKHQPLHDREVWYDGILSTQRVCIPFSIPWRCPLCSIGTVTVCPRESKRIVVNLRGRYDLNDVLPICDNCGQEIHLETPHDVIREQYWPGNPARKSAHIFDTDLFLFYDLLKKHNPGLSEVGFLRTLEQFSLSKGRVGSLNPATFGKAFREWRYSKFSIGELKHSPLFDCPCCTPEQHSVHFDGNKKLYRYSKVPRGSNTQYYDGFIVQNEEVDTHIDVLGYFGETIESSGLCGTTRWKAAKAISKTMANLDETGLEVAGCRHALALKALNMFRGEIFGYPHYLHTKYFSKAKCVWADVMCQYWPWAKSKVNSCPETKDAMSSQPCLSVMHAKAHSWHCQVLWGGRWQPNSAAGAGEEMEQLFSYLSRFNLTTKYMNAAGREEQLTEAAMFWNDRKISSLPSYLKCRLNKTRRDLGELKKELLLL